MRYLWLLSVAVLVLGDFEPARGPRAAEGEEAPAIARVEVHSALPEDVGKETGWSEVPSYLADAKVFAKDPKGRELELTVIESGIVIIAASWTYDGNASGGWTEGVSTRKKLLTDGWLPLDDILWKESDTHTLFAKPFKDKDKLKLHTRKYNQPFFVMPAPAQVTAVQKRISNARTQAADKSKVAVGESAERTETAEATVISDRDDIVVEHATPAPVNPDEWESLPGYLKGAVQLRPAAGNSLSAKVQKDVLVVLAASWAYDGNRSGGWYEGRTTLPQLVAAGWTPIGEAVLKDKGPHTLLRRTLKPGSFKLHTRKHNPPILFVPDPKLASEVAKANALATATNDLRLIKPPQPRKANAQGKGVVLRVHEPDPEDRFANRGILLRELVRQAVLLAAREELGLPTRDDVLRERGNGTGEWTGPVPIDCLVHVAEGGTVSVTLFHFADDKPQLLWDGQLNLDGPDLITDLTARAEALSREQFVDVLKKAGLAGKANATVPRSARTAEASASLAELHPLSQFTAARSLHASLRSEGESPERLADLARAYANLSVLTEHLWYPGHKVFKARALLYSERAVAKWPNSAVSLSGRAYARALVGLHQAALEDVAAAEALPQFSRLEESAELPIVKAFCRFNLSSLPLDELPAAKRPLVDLLHLVAIERFSSTAAVLKASQEFLRRVPDSDRAIDAIHETNELGTLAQAVELGLASTPGQLYRRLSELDGLPSRAERVVASAGSDDSVRERSRRLKVIRELRAAGDIGADPGEPSWQAIAAWVEEVGFLQSTRRMQYLATAVSVGLDDDQAELAPMLVDHPYASFFQGLCDDRTLRKAKLTEATKSINQADVSMNEAFMWSYLYGNGFPQGDELHRMAFKHQDWIYRDLLYQANNSRELAWTKYATHLRRVAPNSPLTISATIEFDWEYAKDRANNWEQQYQDSAEIQGALGRQYAKQKLYDQAIRCLRRQIAQAPSYDAYDALAKVFLELKDEPKWLATWNEFLGQEVFGLDHARARVTVAEHFMSSGKWEAAWPYAEAAADSGAQWAMVCAADCLTGMKRWDEAEEYMKSSARRYPPTAPLWYLWCRRNNRGNAAAAATYVRQLVADPRTGINQTLLSVFYIAEGDKRKALDMYQASLARNGSPLYGWLAALLADELEQPDVRTTSLETVNRTANDPKYMRPHLATLAGLAQEALADEGKMKELPPKVTSLLEKIEDPKEKCQIAYLAGKVLKLHGQEAAAKELFTQAAGVPFTHHAATLSAIELR